MGGRAMARLPLIAASEQGHLKAVQVLLARGAKFDAKAANGATALTQASQGGHTEVVRTLARQGTPTR